MAKYIQAVRGMKDIMPEQTSLWLFVEKVVQNLLSSYGYKQIRTPIVEKTAVFLRAIGDITDIVTKEMYTWQDNEQTLSLRPEGTAGCVRAMIEHNLLREAEQKVYYSGVMFRHERPQKGRYRQFRQIGVETLGFDSAKIDAELIDINYQLWQKLKLKNINLELNSIGSKETRAKYREILLNYFTKYQNLLDDESKARLSKNPLRILDSKNPKLQEIITNVPKITKYLDKNSQQHFAELEQYLRELNISYKINANLVRGLDYYNNTVFEWTSKELGTQGAISAGGRYDNLVEQMGGKPSPASGFAIGMDRLILLLAQNNNYKNKQKSIYIITNGKQAELKSLQLAKTLRQKISDIVVYNNMLDCSLKAQFKKADKLSADFAVIIAQEELDSKVVSLKPLKTRDKQTTKTTAELTNFLIQHYR